MIHSHVRQSHSYAWHDILIPSTIATPTATATVTLSRPFWIHLEHIWMWEKKRTGLSECPTIMTVVSDLCIHTRSSQYITMRLHAAAESSWSACSSPLTIGRSSSHRHSLHGCLPGLLHNHIIGGERAKGWLWRAPQTPWSGVLQYVAVRCSVRARNWFGRTPQTSWPLCVFKRVAHINTLQHTATHCNTLQHTATHCNTLQHTATHCNTLQRSATHCNTRKYFATNCNKSGSEDLNKLYLVAHCTF